MDSRVYIKKAPHSTPVPIERMIETCLKLALQFINAWNSMTGTIIVEKEGDSSEKKLLDIGYFNHYYCDFFSRDLLASK